MAVPIIRAHPTAARRTLLGAILLVAFVLRVFNLDWDHGTHQHPDERYWSIVTDDIDWPGFVGYFDSIGSELNPYTDRDTWVYGTAPLFATKAVASFLSGGGFPGGTIVTAADTVGIDLRDTVTTPDGSTVRVDAFDDGYRVNLIGRLLSALIDTGTVALVYLLGRELFDRRAGMVAAALSAFTVLQIQYAHFHGAEAWVTFFVTAVVLASLRLARGDLRPRVALAVGALLGLAAASKLIAAATLVVPATALLVAAGPATLTALGQLWRGDDDLDGGRFRTMLQALGAGLLVLGGAAVVFRVLQPYAFEGLASLDPRFTADLDYLEGVNRGGNVPWVVQWIDRTPLLYPLESAFRWGMGPGAGLAVLGGVVLACRRVIRQRRLDLLVPLALLAVMVGLVAQQFNPLIRYLLPAYPTALVLAGAAVVALWDRGAGLRGDGAPSAAIGRRRAGTTVQVLAVVPVLATVFWGAAFVNGVYGAEHPRIEASRWMAENLPEGAAISAQIWDDTLPLAIDGVDPGRFTTVPFDLFLPDRAIDATTGMSKVERLLADLDSVDYVVEASNRLYDSIPRIPAKYPATTAYYEALFDGRLGFEQVARFRSSPSLFGIRVADHDAEETFTVYDHPTVTIWAKTERFSVERARAILDPDGAAVAPDVVPADAATNVLLMRPDRLAAAATGATFEETFGDGDGPLVWVWWLIWLQVAALAVVPWTTRLFGALPDRGYGFSKVIGFLTVGLVSWATVAWDVADQSRLLVWAAFVAVVAFGASGWWYDRVRLARIARASRASWLTVEAVFLTVFGLALLLRSANPDLWEAYLGGEKPMELAYLTSVGRTTELPPPDPWFGGGTMNYYYLGWYLLAVPMRALKVVPEVAFNLGVATYAAITATTAYAVVHGLVGVGSRRTAARRRPTARERRRPIQAGLLGVVLLLGIGNLDAIRLHAARLDQVSTWTFADGIPVVGHVVRFAGGTWAWATGTPLGRFDWWGPSRVNKGNIDITEFPYFTFLFGDLHPHMMGITVVGLVTGLAVTLVVSARRGRDGRTWALAVALGVATGAARLINTWDLPTVAILAAAAVVLGQILRRNRPRTPPADDAGRSTAALVATIGIAVGLSRAGGTGGALVTGAGVVGVAALVSMVTSASTRLRILRAVGQLATVAAVHLVVFHPFLSAGETFETGIQGAADLSPLDDFLVHWGVFLVIAAALAAALAVDERRRRRAGDDHVPLLPRVWDGSTTMAVAAGVAAWLLILTAVATVSGAFGLALAGVLVLGALGLRELRRRRPDPALVMTLGMLVLALAVAGGVDVVTVRNDIVRMNTVFKFWLQAWQLFALAGAVAVWYVARILAHRPVHRAAHAAPDSSLDAVDPTSAGRHRARFDRTPARLWVGFVGVLVIAGLAYPLLGTRTRIETRFAALPATLDGLAYLEADPVIVRADDDGTGATTEVSVAIGDDLPLIRWLRAEVAGTPVVAEWAGPAYDWNARIAIHTGMQAVLGWEWHQRQQRWTFQDQIAERLDATRRFFTSGDPSEISRYLRAYDVGFVVVGTQERRFGTPEGLAAIADHPALREVFASGDGRIYRVDPAGLWPALDPGDLDELAAG